MTITITKHGLTLFVRVVVFERMWESVSFFHLIQLPDVFILLFIFGSVN